MSRVVVITGANRGIGYHLARTPIDAGDRVAGLDLEIENLEAIVEMSRGRLMAVACDVSDDHAPENAAGRIVANWGGIDILFNNAVTATFSPFEGFTLDAIRQEFEVNFFGYVRMIKAVLPLMRARGSGIIYNVGSGVGLTGFPNLTPYTSTKGAIEALSRTLALELEGSCVHAGLIHPPLTNTRSAGPLGVPERAMADPETVGQSLARKIGSRRGILTPDFATSAFLFAARRYPNAMGRLLARMSAKGRDVSVR